MKEKYDRIGRFYNRTRTADPYLTEKFFQFLTPPIEGKFLDIGCGTGNYTIALNKMGLDFVGIDPSTEMLSKAKSKSERIHWQKGKSEKIPFEDETFVGAIASLTIHHWSDLTASFSEINRVLKPFGKFVIFTSTPDQTGNYWLKRYFPEMIAKSAQQMPEFSSIESALQKSRFEIVEKENYFVKEDLQDMFLYSGKYNPEIYLDPQIRQGISSFSDLAKADEVALGLEKLRQDIETEKVYQIIEDSKNENGDYLFVVCQKASKV